ncbi:MAG: hypothetical protein ABT940_13280, partial [Alphaproteobacteria bacterium]
VSFYGRVIGAFCASVVAGLAVLQDKSIADVPSVTWIVVVGGAIVQATIAANAWLSTSSSKAREELNGKTDQAQ